MFKNKTNNTISAVKTNVVIIGRPNVGKSTLFNRLTKTRKAIVHFTEGTTRDRLITYMSTSNITYNLVDTPGYITIPKLSETIASKSHGQIHQGLKTATIILFLLDIKVGITHEDKTIASVLRPMKKKIILVANKADNSKYEMGKFDFLELGFDTPIAISAYHNIGISNLTKAIYTLLPKSSANTKNDQNPIKITLSGRPNTGKSMLLNSMINSERSIVSEIPGTTRDSIDTILSTNNISLRLIDTAGIRRRGKITKGIEKFSSIRSIDNILSSDISILLLDCTEISTNQDMHIANYILSSSRGMIIAINKWDLSTEIGITEDEIRKYVRSKFKFANFVPICFLSALKKTGISNLIKTIQLVYSQWSTTIENNLINDTLKESVYETPPSTKRTKSLKIYTAEQDGICPPRFTIKVNDPELVHFSYHRHLENDFRRSLGFTHCPIKINFKPRV